MRLFFYIVVIICFPVVPCFSLSIESVRICNDSVERVQFLVEFADTFEGRQKGLSNRDSIGEKEGMLFDFLEEKRPKIWMKDTRFSLDLIFAREDGMIVYVEPRVPPFSHKIFQPEMKVRFLLEVNGGVASFHNILKGDRLVIGNNSCFK